MAKRKLSQRRVILTGASSGIGRALALQLSQAGAHIVASARREERLQELVASSADLPGRIVSVVGDVTSESTRQALLDTAIEEFGGVELLINNAGIGALGPFAQADQERLRQLMEVNFFAPVELIRTTLPTLQQGQQPMVVNISSVLGHRAVPKKSEYCASKFALHGFSDALRAELTSQGIDLLLVSPSTTSSEFFDSLIDSQGKLPSWSKQGMSPDLVARKTLSAIRRGKHEIILSFGGKALVWLDRLCPALADRLIAKYG